MLKQLFALVRGHGHDAAEQVADHGAMVILRQQIRDCATAVAAARRAVAIAIAQNEQEKAQSVRLAARIADLEARTVIALQKGEHGLARDAADTIAALEAEAASSSEAQQRFTVEITRLKQIVRSSEARLRELRRGQHLAAAVQTTQRLRDTGATQALSTLRDAEETLTRLRLRQRQIDATEAAMADLEQINDPTAKSGRLAAAGCGAPLATTAEAVIRRLTERASASQAVAA